jgi:hypothetical protein
MKKMAHIALVTFLTLSLGRFVEAENIPLMINYQGKIEVAGVPHNGDGYFKFSIIDNPNSPTITYWSNDDTSVAGSEPASFVTLTVNQGLFSVKLGDPNLTNMTTPIGLQVFSTPTVYLRVWFSSDGTAFQRLIPDRQLVSVPYAYRAETAEQVPDLGDPGTINAAGNPVDWTQLKGVPAGIADGTDDTGGTVTSVGTGAGLTGGPITTSGTIAVAPDGITSAMIADGTVEDTDVAAGAGIAGSKISPDFGAQALTAGVGTLTGLSVDSPTLVVDAANNRVGIGTIGPATRLHLLDSTGLELRLQGGDIDAESPVLSLIEEGGAGFQFKYLSNTNRMDILGGLSGSMTELITVIRTSGNVGIGTTSPGAKLSVVGLPTAPVATGGIAAGRGVVCIDSAGNLFIDDDGTVDCL